MDYEKIMGNWIDFNSVIAKLNEKQVEELIDYEIKNQNRKSYITRLMQRLNSIRSKDVKEQIERRYKDET